MGKRQHKKRRKQSPAELAGDYEIYHIGVLDGIRVIAIFLVAWYHIWQQSWLQPLTEHVNLDWLVRNGSILVDMMILLSGFCLFLPYARDMVYGDKTDTVPGFYVKRVARIVPSYYLSVYCSLLLFHSTLGVRRRYRFYDERFDYASDIYEQFIWRCNLYDASERRSVDGSGRNAAVSDFSTACVAVSQMSGGYISWNDGNRCGKCMVF